jgi:MoaD family protein
MRVMVKYFAQLREVTGRAEEEYTLEDSAKLGTLIQGIIHKWPLVGTLILETNTNSLKGSYQILINGRTTRNFGESLHHGEEVAIIPPVAGG